ncbi:MAG: hypothetical protein ACK5KR_04225 [Breznakia sp.]
MEKEARREGKNYKVDAFSTTTAREDLGDYDVVLLGPQIQHDLNNFKKLHDYVAVIPPIVFGTIDAKKAIAIAEEARNA